jgi:phage regulator Rha-like protein
VRYLKMAFTTKIIQDFDKMRESLKLNTEQRKLMTDFRRKLISTEKHSELLASHFDKALNSGELSDRFAKELGLL